MFSSIIMDKMPGCVYCTEIEACFRLVYRLFFPLFCYLFAFLFSECISLSMTFHDLHLNSMTAQAWKFEITNSMTFQVLHDLYEPCHQKFWKEPLRSTKGCFVGMAWKLTTICLSNISSHIFSAQYPKSYPKTFRRWPLYKVPIPLF